MLKSALNWVIQYYGHIVGVRMQGDMRRDVFKRLQKLPFSFFDENGDFFNGFKRNYSLWGLLDGV